MQLANTELGLGERPALLIVDASCAFTDPDSPLGADFAREIDKINELLVIARQLGWPRFFSTVWYESDAEARVFRDKLPALDALQAGAEAVEIDPRLTIDDQDHLFRKTHASCFFGTDLHDRLRSAGVDSLVIGGFTTSGCVRATAVDALQYDYRTTVIEDAVGDRDENAHRANLFDLSAKYADVISLANLVPGISL